MSLKVGFAQKLFLALALQIYILFCDFGLIQVAQKCVLSHRKCLTTDVCDCWFVFQICLTFMLFYVNLSPLRRF
jgi:hypothetical protein